MDLRENLTKNRIGRMSKASDEMNKGWRGKFGVTGIQGVAQTKTAKRWVRESVWQVIS